jgi:hypothetical protein
MDLDKLANGNYQQNLEFMQWFKRAADAKGGAIGGGGTVGGSPGLGRGASFTRMSSTQQSPIGSRKASNDKNAAAAASAAEQQQRAYYFAKLREIEALVTADDIDDVAAAALAKQIQAVLYKP